MIRRMGEGDVVGGVVRELERWRWSGKDEDEGEWVMVARLNGQRNARLFWNSPGVARNSIEWNVFTWTVLTRPGD